MSASIKQAADIIRSGGLVAFPTETVYGLGANALDSLAAAKIFELKERPAFDPLIVHIADPEEINGLAVIRPGLAQNIKALAAKFWPGPLTIVLPKKASVPDIVTAGLSTVGLRVPDNKIALELIRQSGCPLAAPSANKFGRLSPTTAEHVRQQLPELECILDGGSAKIGLESTVIALPKDGFAILRQGAITAEDLAKILPVSRQPVKNNGLASPGLLRSHYSPGKPLYLLGAEPPLDKSRTGCLVLQKAPAGFARTEALSPQGDLRAAAANLFSALHRLEADRAVEYIVAEPVPEEGIGLAIMDKLRKASFRWK
ncbi:MAG: threonylcarbamoyl-AMP synthase [Candidatus Margulisbacteria bacterium]|jgi:L-threonylcarbamoyladenylate synthase|nr:threonylcarbamoyl-AMP synthase [Candidatus Margulisiibacteriota bacterium]